MKSYLPIMVIEMELEAGESNCGSQDFQLLLESCMKNRQPQGAEFANSVVRTVWCTAAGWEAALRG